MRRHSSANRLLPPFAAAVLAVCTSCAPGEIGKEAGDPACGDGACSGAETCTSCPGDCGPCTVALPSCPTVSERRTGTETTAIYRDNRGGTWDLTGAVWQAPSLYPYPVRSDAWAQGCVIGGRLLGPIGKDLTRDQWYNGDDGLGEADSEVRITMDGTADNWLRIDDMYVVDMEDAFDPNAATSSSTTYLNRVHAEYIRDDCVENEQIPHNLVITNSFFDGCFTGFAERPTGSNSARNGTGDFALVVEDSLMYIKPQPLGDRYCSPTAVSRGRCLETGVPNVWLGAHGIWKWSDQAAGKVTIRNTTFRLDLPSYSSCRAQQWPDGTYENVTLVWTGAEPYESAGDCTNTLPPGITLTTDLAAWDAAVAAWRERERRF